MSSALLYLYCLAASLVPNVALAFTEPMSAWGRAANILLPAGLYMLLLAWSRHVGRSVWCFFPVIFFAAFQIVLLKLYGRSVIAVDMFLNLVTTNPSEAGELLGSLTGIVIVDVVLFVPLLVWGALAWQRGRLLPPTFRRRAALTGCVTAAVGALCVWGAYATPSPRYAVADDLYPLNVAYNLVLATQRTSALASYHTTSGSFTAHGRSERPDSLEELLIVVVGETSRAADWQLCGYSRPTNPRLSQRRGLHAFSRALSESNTTHKAVPMLLSPLDASTFGDSIDLCKGLITPFREAGFHTSFISNQGRNHSYIDFFGEEAEEVLFLRDSLTAAQMLHPITDLALLPHIERRLESPRARKQLIVVHTYGSHFSYLDRYSDECRRFTPDSYTGSSADQRDALVNAYDNSILATDLLLDSIISMADRCGVSTALIYTSDHGEDIFDDARGRFLHASPTPTFRQLHVPVLVWTSEKFAALHPELVEALEANRSRRVATSKSFYHTALQLGGVAAATRRDSLSLASPLFTEYPRIYLTDHNRPEPLTEAGFDPIDISLLTTLDR